MFVITTHNFEDRESNVVLYITKDEKDKYLIIPANGDNVQENIGTIVAELNNAIEVENIDFIHSALKTVIKMSIDDNLLCFLSTHTITMIIADILNKPKGYFWSAEEPTQESVEKTYGFEAK